MFRFTRIMEGTGPRWRRDAGSELKLQLLLARETSPSPARERQLDGYRRSARRRWGFCLPFGMKYVIEAARATLASSLTLGESRRLLFLNVAKHPTVSLHH